MNTESRNVGLQSNPECLEAARNDKVIRGGTELQQVATQRGGGTSPPREEHRPYTGPQRAS